VPSSCSGCYWQPNVRPHNQGLRRGACAKVPRISEAALSLQGRLNQSHRSPALSLNQKAGALSSPNIQRIFWVALAKSISTAGSQPCSKNAFVHTAVSGAPLASSRRSSRALLTAGSATIDSVHDNIGKRGSPPRSAVSRLECLSTDAAYSVSNW